MLICFNFNAFHFREKQLIALNHFCTQSLRSFVPIQWYRIQILSRDSSRLRVLKLDIGREEEVTLSYSDDYKPLFGRFRDEPAFALACRFFDKAEVTTGDRRLNVQAFSAYFGQPLRICARNRSCASAEAAYLVNLFVGENLLEDLICQSEPGCDVGVVAPDPNKNVASGPACSSLDRAQIERVKSSSLSSKPSDRRLVPPSLVSVSGPSLSLNASSISMASHVGSRGRQRHDSRELSNESRHLSRNFATSTPTPLEYSSPDPVNLPLTEDGKNIIKQFLLDFTGCSVGGKTEMSCLVLFKEIF